MGNRCSEFVLLYGERCAPEEIVLQIYILAASIGVVVRGLFCKLTGNLHDVYSKGAFVSACPTNNGVS